MATDAARPRRNWRHVVVVNLVVVGLLLFLALVAWVLVPPFASVTPIRADVMAKDAAGHWRFKANLRDEPYLHRPPALRSGIEYPPILVSTNAEGFRDRDHTPQAAPDVLRVAFAGDSFMFGTNLRQDELLSHRVERVLKDRPRRDGRTWEVLNFAIPGLNLQGMGRVVQGAAPTYRPDVVLYSVIGDDFSPTDVLTVSSWQADVPGFLPDGTRDWIGSQLLPRLKELRYTLDASVYDSFHELKVGRMEALFAYIDEIGRTLGHRPALLLFHDFSAEVEAYRAKTGSTIASMSRATSCTTRPGTRRPSRSTPPPTTRPRSSTVSFRRSHDPTRPRAVRRRVRVRSLRHLVR